jgi:hypothetical protein
MANNPNINVPLGLIPTVEIECCKSSQSAYRQLVRDHNLFENKGDLVTSDGDQTIVLNIGPDNSILTADSASLGGISWVTSTNTCVGGLCDNDGDTTVTTTGNRVLVNADNGFSVGSFEPDCDDGCAIPVEGPGRRLMFHAGEYGLRSGLVTDDQWDQINFGTGSVAFGENTIASGDLSFAQGLNSIASGPGAVAMGTGVESSEVQSFAIGTNTVASGRESFAGGNFSVASGENAISYGINCDAFGDGSVSLGNNCSTDDHALAVGFNCSAGLNGKALGNNCVAGVSAMAAGSSCNAVGSFSTAVGENIVADGSHSFAGGQNSNSSVFGIHGFAYGSGVAVDGESACAFGIDTESSGRSSVAFGEQSTASGDRSLAAGFRCDATNESCIAMGYESEASGIFSSFSLGDQTICSGGFGAHAAGFQSRSTGSSSFSEGLTCWAQGAGSHAEGQLSRAFDQASHCEGSTCSSGGFAHCGGSDSDALGFRSFVHGSRLRLGDPNFSEPSDFFTKPTWDDTIMEDCVLFGKNCWLNGTPGSLSGPNLANVDIASVLDLDTTTGANPPTYNGGTEQLTAGINEDLSTAGTIDSGYVLNIGDRVLVKNLVDGSNLLNGIYNIIDLGSGTTPWILERTVDMASGSAFGVGTTTYIVNGTVHGGEQWFTTTFGTVDINSILWTTPATTVLREEGLYLGNGTLPFDTGGVRIALQTNTTSGTGYATNWTTGGADYAEYFEWNDGNPDGEDRTGYFVCLENADKIGFATSDVDVIGVVSAIPGVIGNAEQLRWKGQWLRDAFGRIQMQTSFVGNVMGKLLETKAYTIFAGVENQKLISDLLNELKTIGPGSDDDNYQLIPDAITQITGLWTTTNNLTEDENLELLNKIVTMIKNVRPMDIPITNPDYDTSVSYISRGNRPEWGTIGLMGRLRVYDDGTCMVGDTCSCNTSGVATSGLKWRVISRIEENIVEILLI